MSRGACFWRDEDADGQRDFAEHRFCEGAVLDWYAKLDVQFQSFCEFEASEEVPEAGEGALRMRADGRILEKMGGWEGKKCRIEKIGTESEEKLLTTENRQDTMTLLEVLVNIDSIFLCMALKVFVVVMACQIFSE